MVINKSGSPSKNKNINNNATSMLFNNNANNTESKEYDRLIGVGSVANLGKEESI